MPRKKPLPKPPRGRPAKVLTPHSPAEQIGAALRKRRQAAGLTIRAAAAQLDVPEGRWTDWEHGRGMPSLLHVPYIAAVLGCEIADLLPKSREARRHGLN